MTGKKFNEQLTETLVAINELLQSKGHEYVVGHDRFHNFEKAAALQRIPREQVMLNYSMKHFISITDMIENVKDLPCEDKINEKFNDMIAYLLLMKISLLDRHS